MENPPEDKEKKIIICCSRGQIGRDIAEELQEQGYEAYSLKGGYVGWLMADMKKKEADDVCEHVELSIRKKFKKKIWSKFTKAVREYELVKEGDTDRSMYFRWKRFHADGKAFPGIKASQQI